MKINPEEFRPARRHAHVTPGAVIRTLREMKGWTQEVLAQRCGISATNLSMLENDRIDIGKKRVELIAKAFGIHPAIIMFPEYEDERHFISEDVFVERGARKKIKVNGGAVTEAESDGGSAV